MPDIPCTACPAADCGDCPLAGRLMCRYEKRDPTQFFMIMMPFLLMMVAGSVRSGLGVWLLGILAYEFYFFFVWEARVLCRHFPHWAEEGRMPRCHANYGLIKF